MGKPEATTLKRGKIKPTRVDDEFMSFSFRYLDESSSKFSFQDFNLEQMRIAFQRMKAISGKKLLELNRERRTKPLRWHPIIWNETTEPKGFSHIRNRELWSECAYQFALSKDTGRIHGFVTGNTFNIVWFDATHALYT